MSIETRQKEVYWVTFPFSDSVNKKHRPALIISNDRYNAENEDVLACAITSVLKPRQYSVLLEEKSFTQGGLPLQSRLRADKIVSIEKNLLSKKAGLVSKETFSKIIIELNNLVSDKAF